MIKNYYKESYKTRDEWLSHRGIGGSSAAAIVDRSKWKTPLDVYNDIVHGSMGVKDKTNSRMIEGTLAEEHIRAMFILEHPQYKVTSPPKKTFWMFRRKDYPLLTLTPDGLFEKANGELWGLEIKDVELRKKDDVEAWEDNILPDQYYMQCLHYMVVKTDLAGVILIARLKYYKFDENNDYVFDYAVERKYIIARSDEIVDQHVKWLEKKEINFIVNNIQAKQRPKVKVKF